MKVAGVPDVRSPDLVDADLWQRITACARGESDWPLVFVGPAGTGKTCAALCIMDWVKRRQYETVQTMADDLIAAQNGTLERGSYLLSLRGWWNDYASVDCAVVDELGSREKVSDFQYEAVKRAIDERYNKPAIFISNLSLAELAAVYDDRIASRLAGGTVIRFSGEDRRLTQ